MKEAATSSHIRRESPYHDCELWRNNVGVAEDMRGVPVRYGLANESRQQNQQIKSSDYIGITTIIITQEMVGQKIGVFTAVETKKSNWSFLQSCKRSVAQKTFHDIVKNAGGFAGFATCVDEFKRIIGK